MTYYYNGAGQRLPLWERVIEPPDCWGTHIKNKYNRLRPELEYARKELDEEVSCFMEPPRRR